ncbi:hypothetical protein GJAV_G00093120 [Gymnothorax javanicus]|nr:hypothetical protein GJAV_G00093120 [Gymnothorax javanicus]
MSAELWPIGMDKNDILVFKLFVVGILITTVMTSDFSATGSTKLEEVARPRGGHCNESALLVEMEQCASQFRADMAQIDPQDWCNITHFIREYNDFSACTETESMLTGCYWPNPLVESYIIEVHRQFFSNCTVERVVLVDPPEDTLIFLIAVPVLLTLIMITVVVWRSKRGDIMG